MIQKHIEMNALSKKMHQEFTEDVFSFLRSATKEYNFIILDPPAFAKRKSDIEIAARGYKDINRIAFEKLPSGGLLLTASCSYHISDELFRKIIFSAALEAKKNVRIIESNPSSYDHPTSVYFPEGNYLKSYLCYVT